MALEIAARRADAQDFLRVQKHVALDAHTLRVVDIVFLRGQI